MKNHDLKEEFSTGKIIAAAIEVHRILGPGFLESAYHKALEKELSFRYISHESEKSIKVFYKNEIVAEHKLDMFVEDKVVVELKTVKEISDVYISQVVAYLKATNTRVGLILNFSKPRLEIKRVVWN